MIASLSATKNKIVSPTASDSEKRKALCAQINCTNFVAELLLQRNISDPESARSYFLSPIQDHCHSASELKNLAEAVEALLKIKEKKEKVFIHGDYDVDGVTGTALLLMGFKACGFYVEGLLPNRFTDGYGISTGTVDRIHAQGGKWIVSVDTGVSAVAEVAYAKSLGIGVIITDHHRAPDPMPAADFLINPNQPKCNYPNKGLSGVGVAYKLLDCLFQKILSKGAEEYLPLVALGTLADSMPLQGENRAMVKDGLRVLASSGHAGMNALIEQAGLNKKELSSSDILFKMTPMINAVGRMGNPEIALQLLQCDDITSAKTLSQAMWDQNQKRRSLDQRMTEEAISQVEDKPEFQEAACLVVASPLWHEGVIGIVAARLVERFNKPSLVMAIDSEGMAKGSGRSVEGFSLHAALQKVEHLFEKWGGHSQACGFSIREERISELQDKLANIDDSLLQSLETEKTFHPQLEVHLKEIDAAGMLWLKRFEPFGQENELPLFYAEVNGYGEPRLVGMKHLKFAVEQEGYILDAIAFNLGHLQDFLLKLGGPMKIAFYPEWNTFRNRKQIQLRVVAIG